MSWTTMATIHDRFTFTGEHGPVSHVFNCSRSVDFYNLFLDADMMELLRAIIQSGAATAPWAIEPRDVALARTVVLYNAMKCGNMSLQNPDYDKILTCFLRADADLIRYILLKIIKTDD
ncbi:hypothetical protein TELCIR_02474 [Teladorsagia circumcincta]|uniref:Uncharacterized protein n=1 Tax=Teladorsagia circumcincta TaxID=45464 RepID=A0A2G9V0J4_TELCI|nr:hypothetical protein TELCIR_02474 [Teladorsagia circumcincta]